MIVIINCFEAYGENHILEYNDVESFFSANIEEYVMDDLEYAKKKPITCYKNCQVFNIVIDDCVGIQYMLIGLNSIEEQKLVQMLKNMFCNVTMK